MHSTTDNDAPSMPDLTRPGLPQQALVLGASPIQADHGGVVVQDILLGM